MRVRAVRVGMGEDGEGGEYRKGVKIVCEG